MRRLFTHAALSTTLLLSLSGGGTPAHAILWGDGVCARLYRALSGRPAVPPAPHPPLATGRIDNPPPPPVESRTSVAALTETTPPKEVPFSDRKIENLDDLLLAFTQGLKPDLTDSDQRAAFEIYRRMRFGDPTTSLKPDTLDQVAYNLKKHPELEKEPFRNFTIEAQGRVYPVTKELAEYLDSQVRSAGQLRANLFQVEANSGYWKKVFQFEADKAASKEQVKAQWLAKLQAKLPEELRRKLLDSTKPAQERATLLFQVLKKERESLRALGKDVRPISQAMVDLVHTIGYHDPVIAQAFKSTNGMERLNAFRKVLDERDRFAMALGFPDHFDQVLKEIGQPVGVTIPSGFPSASGLTDKLAKLEQGIVAGAQTLNAAATSKTVRHLSLVESPFRSCLGGSDCSSRTYLTRALDPNYHYFTLTDETGTSSGQITIVLGEAKSGGNQVKMAFVDKVQNVQNSELPVMLEAMRRSVAEKGYILGIPDSVGDHNGLSNEEMTRAFVQSKIAKDPAKPLRDFKPHPHSYNFPNTYSRAESKLASHALAPLELPQEMELMPAELTSPWRTGPLKMEKLLEASKELKNSTKLEDRMRYIASMKALQVAGFTSDPEFNSVVSHWISDRETPFVLRKQAILFKCTEESQPLFPFLANFSPNDQLQLVQNIMDSPRYRGLILKDKKAAIDYLVLMRENKKARESLIEFLLKKESSELVPMINELLDTRELSSEAISETVELGMLGLEPQLVKKIVLAEKKAATDGKTPEVHGLALLNSYKEIESVVIQQESKYQRAPSGSLQEAHARQLAIKAVSAALEVTKKFKVNNFDDLLKIIPVYQAAYLRAASGSRPEALYRATVSKLIDFLGEALDKEGVVSQLPSWEDEIARGNVLNSAYQRSSDSRVEAILKRARDMAFDRAVDNYNRSLERHLLSVQEISTALLDQAARFEHLYQRTQAGLDGAFKKMRDLAIQAAKTRLPDELHGQSKEDLKKLLATYNHRYQRTNGALEGFWRFAMTAVENELRR